MRKIQRMPHLVIYRSKLPCEQGGVLTAKSSTQVVLLTCSTGGGLTNYLGYLTTCSCEMYVRCMYASNYYFTMCLVYLVGWAVRLGG